MGSTSRFGSLDVFHGTVVAGKLWNTTHVSSSGGGGYIGPQGGHVYAPQVRSTVTQYEQLFVRSDTQEERAVTIRNGVDIGVREGHRVSLLYAGSAPVGIHVHDTGSQAHLRDTKRAGYGLLFSVFGAFIAVEATREGKAHWVHWGCALLLLGLAAGLPEWRILRHAHSAYGQLRRGPLPQSSSGSAPAYGRVTALLLLLASAAFAGSGYISSQADVQVSSGQASSHQAPASELDRTMTRLHAKRDLPDYRPAPRVTVYRAQLSEADHFNSKGVRLATAGAVLVQDRANFYDKLDHDAADEADFMLQDRAVRARYAASFESSLSQAERERILRDNVLVEVRLSDEQAQVKIID
jgi:hypothetical protein